MKKAIAFILFFFACNSCHLIAQKNIIQYSKYCSKLIVQVSDKWIADSLGKDGYRHKLSDKLMHCKIDTVHNTDVLKWLGNPNEKSDSDGLMIYSYDFFSAQHTNGWIFNMKILFEFNPKTLQLITIGYSDNDRG